MTEQQWTNWELTLDYAKAERAVGFQEEAIRPDLRLLMAVFGHNKSALRKARKLVASQVG